MELPCKVILLFMALLLPIASHGLESINQQCSKNFTSDTNNQQLLQANINNALFGLLGKTPLHGFAISSFGQSLDTTIYGLTSCRGDVSLEACSECIIIAAQTIRKICPYSAQSYIRYEYCLLRYDTSSFFGQPDMGGSQAWYSSHIAEDPMDFKQGVKKLTGEVIVKAAAGDEKFGFGESFLPKSHVTVYEMAQCTRDLQETACKQCLEKLSEHMFNYSDRLGCYVVGTSCVLRYEIQSFITAPAAQSPDAYAPAPL
ncbi:Cysteine-rich receptor-like protein kinase 29 [Platanthera zijinensis]|uniref:Cysteine-rich receptor-like protein kinase 29 n=1 Tax=Platanthera zijinensis TaxID=2320716 RepID=A0AAP0BL83_9ASPA